MSELKFNYYADVKQGKLPYSVSQDIARDLKLFEGTRVEIILKKKRKGVSKEQRGYYRAAICTAFQQGALEHWGEQLSSDEAHENLKSQCNYKEVIGADGEVAKVILSTEKLDTLERETYHENCRKLIYNYFGIIVGMPDEQTDLNFERTET